MVIIGPSGSGKSTLLRTINRLESITAGSVVVDGFDLYSPAVDINKVRMEVGMVFQSFNLFPHMTVLGNLTIAPMKLKKTPRPRPRPWPGGSGKGGHPGQGRRLSVKLSGGQQQRVPSPGVGHEPEDHALRRAHLGSGPEMIGEVLDSWPPWPGRA